MEKYFAAAPTDAPMDRVYIACITLSAFKGRRHVEAHLFRYGADAAELAALLDKDLVGPPDPDVPQEILQGATREAALRSILEAFTLEECKALVAYLEQRYADHIEKVTVCPLEMPFTVWAFYDLDIHEPLMTE